ncbi:hypothetical protein AYI69_g4017 [Smittium culicis]|uniref:RRM domain-containing protein n=1 Tax=Smittium culicis TaxID=133412 RepID=A0A1R1YHC5_9FUNG|nr:hypothetical protein AYI69_g4017 [Smittium culicis]
MDNGDYNNRNSYSSNRGGRGGASNYNKQGWNNPRPNMRGRGGNRFNNNYDNSNHGNNRQYNDNNDNFSSRQNQNKPYNNYNNNHRNNYNNNNNNSDSGGYRGNFGYQNHGRGGRPRNFDNNYQNNDGNFNNRDRFDNRSNNGSATGKKRHYFDRDHDPSTDASNNNNNIEGYDPEYYGNSNQQENQGFNKPNFNNNHNNFNNYNNHRNYNNKQFDNKKFDYKQNYNTGFGFKKRPNRFDNDSIWSGGRKSALGINAPPPPSEPIQGRSILVQAYPPNPEIFSFVSKKMHEFGDVHSEHNLIDQRGICFFNYQDLRSARNAWESLQGLTEGIYNFDVRYSLPKSNSQELGPGILRFQGTILAVLEAYHGEIIDSNDDDVFKQFGEVRGVYPFEGRQNTRVVEYFDLRSAEAAYSNLHETNLNNKGKIHVIYLWDGSLGGWPPLPPRNYNKSMGSQYPNRSLNQINNNNYPNGGNGQFDNFNNNYEQSNTQFNQPNQFSSNSGNQGMNYNDQNSEYNQYDQNDSFEPPRTKRTKWSHVSDVSNQSDSNNPNDNNDGFFISTEGDSEYPENDYNEQNPNTFGGNAPNPSIDSDSLLNSQNSEPKVFGGMSALSAINALTAIAKSQPSLYNNQPSIENSSQQNTQSTNESAETKASDSDANLTLNINHQQEKIAENTVTKSPVGIGLISALIAQYQQKSAVNPDEDENSLVNPLAALANSAPTQKSPLLPLSSTFNDSHSLLLNSKYDQTKGNNISKNLSYDLSSNSQDESQPSISLDVTASENQHLDGNDVSSILDNLSADLCVDIAENAHTPKESIPDSNQHNENASEQEDPENDSSTEIVGDEDANSGVSQNEPDAQQSEGSQNSDQDVVVDDDASDEIKI